jgi:hypothetical protein
MSTKNYSWEQHKNNLSEKLTSESKYVNIIANNNDIYNDMIKLNNYSQADRISIEKLVNLIESNLKEKIQQKFVICDDKRLTDPQKYRMLNKLISKYQKFSYKIKDIPHTHWSEQSSLEIHDLIMDIMKANVNKPPGSCTILISGINSGSRHNYKMMLNKIYTAACIGFRFKIISWDNSNISNYKNIAKCFDDDRITFTSLNPYYKDIVYTNERFIIKPILNPELDSSSDSDQKFESKIKAEPYVDNSWKELDTTFKVMNLLKKDKICMCNYYCGGIDCKSITVEWVKSL